MPRRQLSSAKSAVRRSTSWSRGCFSTARIASRSSVVSATKSRASVMASTRTRAVRSEPSRASVAASSSVLLAGDTGASNYRHDRRILRDRQCPSDCVTRRSIPSVWPTTSSGEPVSDAADVFSVVSNVRNGKIEVLRTDQEEAGSRSAVWLSAVGSDSVSAPLAPHPEVVRPNGPRSDGGQPVTGSADGC